MAVPSWKCDAHQPASLSEDRPEFAIFRPPRGRFLWAYCDEIRPLRPTSCALHAFSSQAWWEVTRDSAASFYLDASMSLSTMFAAGLALARPELAVWAFTSA